LIAGFFRRTLPVRKLRVMGFGTFLAKVRPLALKSLASALARARFNSDSSALDRLNCLLACRANRFASLWRRLAWRACSRSTFNSDSAVATRMWNNCTSLIRRLALMEKGA